MILTFPGQLDLATDDRLGFGEVYRLYFGRVTGLCRHLLRDRAIAEDAASEAFLRIRDGLARYDASVPMERWVLRIAANHCIDLLRRRRLEQRWFVEEPGVEPASATATPLTLVLLKEQRELVERSLAKLDEAYRVPMVLRYYAELSYDEIAAELDLEKTQVAGRIFRAKQMLRLALKETL